MKLIGVVFTVLVVILITGCQSNIDREYFEPTEKTAIQGEDGLWRGAVKKEAGKKGYRDAGDASFNFSANIFGF